MDIYQPTHKHCNKCNNTLSIENFNKNKYGKDGFRSICKKCDHTYYKKKYKKKYSMTPIENCKFCYKCNRMLPLSCFHKRTTSKDGVRSNCKDCSKQYNFDRYTRLARTITKRRYGVCNTNKTSRQKELSRLRHYTRTKERLLNDPLFRLTHNMRSLIGQAFRKRGYTKKSKTYEILGCSFDDFKIYIENQFTEGMSWDNRSEWHLDHIVPVSFGKTELEIIALNHYTNFQPLWAIDNIKKSNKLI